MWNSNIITILIVFLVIVIVFIKYSSVPVFFRRLKYFFYSPNYYEAKLVREILSRKSDFFKSLSETGKNRMIKKSIHFMMSKRFIGMEGLELTDEMIAEISGTAAQLTFGLKQSGFSHFHTIKIFPETFYSGMFNRHLKGGASIGGVLFFSWEDFQQGFADASDRYNLGLHEMAHALRLELHYGKDFDRWFADYSGHWMKIALPEFQKMKHGNPSFLRDYAATNMEEFFSVCIEHFFEVPEDFKANLPDIYNHLCYLLRIDPLNTKNDYRLEENFIQKINLDKSKIPIPEKMQRSYENDSWHWSFNFIMIGFFVAFPLIIINLKVVMIQKSMIAVSGGLIIYFVLRFRDFFQTKGIFLFRHLVLFAIVGVALPVIATGLMINRYSNSDKVTYSYIITGHKIRNLGGGKSEFTFQLSGDAFDEFPAARQIVNSSPDKYLEKAQYLILSTSTGALGFDNIESRHLVIDNDTVEVSNTNF